MAAIYYTIGVHPRTPTAASSRYTARKKPILRAGQRIKDVSVDKVGNAGGGELLRRVTRRAAKGSKATGAHRVKSWVGKLGLGESSMERGANGR